ncbi:hypothetical protein LAZ67_5001210 [Cordylochernes scorpioides]|uniref:Integrase catalytic domain-containing protein n=1 Tax=Cordylochernes scorpioides TaxID=51811 RepID=A0ABY6KFE6_9ARAC|nr:hypothetical protein LAZ67_5001210 [Cordylochernes scorpioides]
MSIQNRIGYVKQNQLCSNCLRGNHSVENCKITNRCFHCNKNHHTLLHVVSSPPRQRESSSVQFASPKSVQPSNVPSTSTSCCLSEANGSIQILLSTAIIHIQDVNGEDQICRALLDNGSQRSLITEKCAAKLGIPIRRKRIAVGGLGDQLVESSLGEVLIRFSSHFDHQSFETTALVLTKLTNNIPNVTVNKINYSHMKGLILADPSYFKSREIDVILGSDIVFNLIQEGRRNGNENEPSAIHSKLGWLVYGPTSVSEPQSFRNLAHFSSELESEDLIKRFWELESIPSEEIPTKEEKDCESHYLKNVVRDESGRYIVRLPFKESAEKLGQSKSIAIRRFLNLKKRLEQNENIYVQYKQFMNEYIRLGHMMASCSLQTEPKYYIPHHCILKAQPNKLRVVFDASSKTTTQISLNDLLHVGSKLQNNIFNILLKFRTNSVALVADIEKMYRQIRLHPDDIKYQTILWIDCKDLELQEYNLLTVTYGLACAPYLAIRTLHQIAHEVQVSNPRISKIIREDFYVDDLLTGCPTMKDAKGLMQQLIAVLGSGGFVLRKWVSNETSIIEDLPLLLRGKADIKSKRQIVSAIARFYDPCGWLSPTTVVLKLLLQELWKLKIGWDEDIPASIQRKITYENNQIETILLTAKTKVAPIKKITIQRLKLCAALMLAQLQSQTTQALPFKIDEQFYWTDSKIVLAWITSESKKWQIFVANRVAQIQELTAAHSWQYISGKQNPADFATRGILPSCLINSKLWWHGPTQTMASLETQNRIHTEFVVSEFMVQLEAWWLQEILHCKFQIFGQFEHSMEYITFRDELGGSLCFIIWFRRRDPEVAEDVFGLGGGADTKDIVDVPAPKDYVMGNLAVIHRSIERIEISAIVVDRGLPIGDPFACLYIDDIFCICTTTQTENILCNLNNYHPDLHFTVEKENNNTLPFLDINIIRYQHELHTTVYYKPSFRPNYVPYSSFCPISHKINTVIALSKRVHTHCSLRKYKNLETQNIIANLKNCAYPMSFILRHFYVSSRETQPPIYRSICNMPYSPLSSTIARFLLKFGIKTYFNCAPTSGSLLRNQTMKHNEPPSSSRNVIYSIECSNCPKIYVGETGRQGISRLRFINITRKQPTQRLSFLTSQDLKDSLLQIVKNIQRCEFTPEINACIKNIPLPRKSRLISLNIFIDSQGILRVGGRLRHSDLDIDQKHPMLIPKDHFVTKLIVMHYHINNLHSGTQLTLSLIRNKYWIPSGRNLIKRVLNQCLVCLKSKSKAIHQIMGDLPKNRLLPGRPFEKIGIDLAGPIQARPILKRSKVIFKFYIVLFVCFTTKAIHLEISSDLTAETFLAALKRFISRRGRPTDIYSDNATNFKGASNILKERWRLFNAANIQDFFAIESINWHFIPPSAPNFGGLWEAGIKSVKTILSKTMKSRLLNYEELLTLLAQIEVCLNSRPLTFVSNDPNDLTALTPGHFLIGNAIRHDAESDHSALNLRSRWDLIQPQRDYFWNRWSCEYLHQLKKEGSGGLHIRMSTLEIWLCRRNKTNHYNGNWRELSRYSQEKMIMSEWCFFVILKAF